MNARRSILLNLFWAPLFFQDAVMVAIAVPAALLVLAPHQYVRIDAIIVALAAFASMIVPPVAGAVSDALRRRAVPRRACILLGAGLDAACLILASQTHRLDLFMLFIVLATVGNNISLAAYQPLIPEIVPRAAWGMVSGVRSVAMIVGTVIGLVVAAETNVASTFIGMGIGIAVGALSLLLVAEQPIAEQPQERAKVSDWNDFSVVFAARFFLSFGLTLLMTYVLYFFKDVLHVRNPSTGTGFVAMASLGGAILSGIYLGWLSDRVPRKIVVACCGIPMVAAAAGFALVPSEHWMYGFAVLFGIGFGGVMSTGWALAIDSVPQLRDVARDLGIWGIAQNLPAVLAPIAGWLLLQAYHNSLGGYRVLFFSAAGCFALGSSIVLSVGSKPLVPWWAVPLRLASAYAVTLYLAFSARSRVWGKLVAHRGPSLIVSNHQVELDLFAPIARFVIGAGRRNPVLAVSARMMYEPGWMAVRFPWLWRALYRIRFGWFFEGIGFLPLENELQRRSVYRWACDAQTRHPALPLDELFKDEFVQQHGLHGLRTTDLYASAHFHTAHDVRARLSDLRQPYKREAFEEMRRGVDRDLAHIEDALRRGATFYVTPEGEYSRDGRMLPFRGIWDRLEPHARHIHLLGISYDPFVGSRLSQLYRVVNLRDRSNVVAELRAARPVTTSALLAQWLMTQRGGFTQADAQAALLARLRDLPEGLFVDPELRAQPKMMGRRALARMVQLGILRRPGNEYELAPVRRHPQFAHVEDIVAFQAAFFEETLEGLNACVLPPPALAKLPVKQALVT